MSVPAIWPTQRAKWLLERQSRPSRPHDGVVTAFRDGQVTLRANRRLDGFTEAVQEIGYQGIRKGDLVVHSMDGFAGAIGVSDSDGKASPVVHAYRVSDGTDPRFAAYVLRTMASSGYIESLAKGIRERSTSFDVATLANLQLPCPPVNEQRRIADFLDAETAKIDQLASLRTEQRVWFDKREASWRSKLFRQSKSGILTRVKYLLRVKPRYGVLVPQFVDDGIPFIRVNNLPGVISRESLAKIPPELSAQYARTITMPGDVLVSVVGSLGKTTVITDDLVGANTARAVAVLRLKQKYAPPLFAAWIGTPEFERQALLATGADSAQPTLGMEDLANFSVRWPADDAEQKEMTEAAYEHRTQNDAARSLINRQLAVFAERRQALITAGVTGQIDVTTAGGVAV